MIRAGQINQLTICINCGVYVDKLNYLQVFGSGTLTESHQNFTLKKLLEPRTTGCSDCVDLIK